MPLVWLDKYISYDMWWWTKILLDRNAVENYWPIVFNSLYLTDFCQGWGTLHGRQALHGWGQWQGIHTGSFAPYALPPSNVSREHHVIEGTRRWTGASGKRRECCLRNCQRNSHKAGKHRGCAEELWSCCCSAEESKRWNFEGRSFTANLAAHNLPLGTIIFDGFLPFLTLFTTF